MDMFVTETWQIVDESSAVKGFLPTYFNAENYWIWWKAGGQFDP